MELTKSFALLTETDRSKFVRSMLLSMTSPEGVTNELLGGHTASRKRTRRASEDAYCTTGYYIRGKPFCRAAFSTFVQMNSRTVNRLGKFVTSTESFHLAERASKPNNKGKLTVQSIVAIDFLKYYGELNSISCPTRRGSTEDESIHWLPIHTTRAHVHKNYRSEWEPILKIKDYQGASLPTEPLMQNIFEKLWRAHAPWLRIIKSGSDFCDTCTHLSSLVSSATEFSMRDSITQVRNKHREEAAEEFFFYKSIQNSTLLHPNDGTVHLTFYFAEKVLLRYLLRQP